MSLLVALVLLSSLEICCISTACECVFLFRQSFFVLHTYYFFHKQFFRQNFFQCPMLSHELHLLLYAGYDHFAWINQQFAHVFYLPILLTVTETGFIPVNEVIQALIASYSDLSQSLYKSHNL